MKEQRILAQGRARGSVGLRLRGEGGCDRPARVVGAGTHSLRLAMASPPARGMMVEILVGRQSLSGWVRWRLGRRCGITLAEPINVFALLAGDVVPLRMTPAAAEMLVPRRTLAAALASDGPLAARVLQAAAILAIFTGGAAWALHVAAVEAENPAPAQVAVTEEGQSVN